MRFIERRVFAFLLAGCVNSVVTYLLYVFLLWCSVPYRVSYSVTFICGIGVAYWLNAAFVFRQKPRVSTAVAYPLVYLVQYGVGIGLLSLFVEAWGLSAWVAPLLVVAFSVPLTFVLSRLVFSCL